MKVKFIKKIGYAEIGSVEDYPESKANALIKKGVAVAFAETEESSATFFKSKKKGVTADV